MKRTRGRGWAGQRRHPHLPLHLAQRRQKGKFNTPRLLSEGFDDAYLVLFGVARQGVLLVSQRVFLHAQ